MKITKREILFSVIIIVVLLVIGFLISSSINTSLLDKFQEYDTALQIDNDAELFQYGMRTSVGNAFVFGELRAVDTVSYPDVSGEYSYISKRVERYTEHTRTVTEEDDDGNTYTTTETYYEWDYIDSESKHSETIEFLGVEFSYGTIQFPSSEYIDTVYERSEWYHRVGDLRYKYEGAPTRSDVTIYAKLIDRTIRDVQSHPGRTIQQVFDSYESKDSLVVFWVLWIMLIVGAVVGFYYLDNRWLEDKQTH